MQAVNAVTGVLKTAGEAADNVAKVQGAVSAISTALAPYIESEEQNTMRFRVKNSIARDVAELVALIRDMVSGMGHPYTDLYQHIHKKVPTAWFRRNQEEISNYIKGTTVFFQLLLNAHEINMPSSAIRSHRGTPATMFAILGMFLRASISCITNQNTQLPDTNKHREIAEKAERFLDRMLRVLSEEESRAPKITKRKWLYKVERLKKIERLYQCTKEIQYVFRSLHEDQYIDPQTMLLTVSLEAMQREVVYFIFKILSDNSKLKNIAGRESIRYEINYEKGLSENIVDFCGQQKSIGKLLSIFFTLSGFQRAIQHAFYTYTTPSGTIDILIKQLSMILDQVYCSMKTEAKKFTTNKAPSVPVAAQAEKDTSTNSQQAKTDKPTKQNAAQNNDSESASASTKDEQAKENRANKTKKKKLVSIEDNPSIEDNLLDAIKRLGPLALYFSLLANMSKSFCSHTTKQAKTLHSFMIIQIRCLPEFINRALTHDDFKQKPTDIHDDQPPQSSLPQQKKALSDAATHLSDLLNREIASSGSTSCPLAEDTGATIDKLTKIIGIESYMYQSPLKNLDEEATKSFIASVISWLNLFYKSIQKMNIASPKLDKKYQELCEKIKACAEVACAALKHIIELKENKNEATDKPELSNKTGKGTKTNKHNKAKKDYHLKKLKKIKELLTSIIPKVNECLANIENPTKKESPSEKSTSCPTLRLCKPSGEGAHEPETINFQKTCQFADLITENLTRVLNKSIETQNKPKTEEDDDNSQEDVTGNISSSPSSSESGTDDPANNQEERKEDDQTKESEEGKKETEEGKKETEEGKKETEKTTPRQETLTDEEKELKQIKAIARIVFSIEALTKHFFRHVLKIDDKPKTGPEHHALEQTSRGVRKNLEASDIIASASGFFPRQQTLATSALKKLQKIEGGFEL